MTNIEALKCPRCLDEEMIRLVGRFAVCPGCDITVMLVPEEEPTPEAA